MFTIHFTTDDLARTRIVASYGPLAEALFSLGVLADRRQHGALFGGWREQLTGERSGWAPHLGWLNRGEPLLDLFTLIGRVSTVEQGTDALLSLRGKDLQAEVDAAAEWAKADGRTPVAKLPAWALRLHADLEIRSVFAAMLQECQAATIGAHWASIEAHVEAEAAVRARILAHDGWAYLVGSLHPDMRWRDGVLQINETHHVTDSIAATVFAHGPDPSVSVGIADIHLGGRGIILVPSVFCRAITPYVSVADHDGPAVLFYPALREITDAHRLWIRRHPQSSHRALVALLGTTRASALEVVASVCTTTELAGRLRVSAATASYHAAVLRDAGLITTRRHASAVLHTISPLGIALLNGEPPHQPMPLLPQGWAT
jgi:DNA-binding transcriptional ArsR family regulator